MNMPPPPNSWFSNANVCRTPPPPQKCWYDFTIQIYENVPPSPYLIYIYLFITSWLTCSLSYGPSHPKLQLTALLFRVPPKWPRCHFISPIFGTHNFMVEMRQLSLGHLPPGLLLLLSLVLVVLVKQIHARQGQHHERLDQSRRRKISRHVN